MIRRADDGRVVDAVATGGQRQIRDDDEDQDKGEDVNVEAEEPLEETEVGQHAATEVSCNDER